MNRRIWTALIGILALISLCANVWQYKICRDDRLEAMCSSSIYSALQHFEAYSLKGDESDYIAGVAEFRTYMTAYFCLAGGASDTNYIWCNTLYGYMTLHQERVKAYANELAEALEYLAGDYDHPYGFHLINGLNHQLDAA